MALLHSLDIPLETPMPTFSLNDSQGKSYTNDVLMGDNGLLVVFTCNHCPYAIAVWPRLKDLAKEAAEKGIAFVAINPNINPDYPDDRPEKMQSLISTYGIEFPYLVDAKQEVARLFQAQCTPDFFLFDARQRLYYHGRLDDNWQHPDQVKQRNLADAITSLGQKKTAPSDQVASMGCSIKWL